MSLARKSLFLLLVIALTITAFHRQILTECFSFLVKAGPPVKADIAVVLAGDGYGQRILKGGELVREGYVPVAIVSGPLGFYDTPECDFAIAFAVRHGYPESYFQHFHGTLHSTEDEAVGIMAELKKRGVKSILLVTTGYHTRRAGGIFERHRDGIEVHVVAAPDKETDNGWYTNREGRKKIVIEWLKTVTGPFGF